MAQYKTYKRGVSSVREGIRDSYFVTDEVITALGFAGIEGIDWKNIKAIDFSWSRYWTQRSLFFLDGTIIDIGGAKYFKDRSSAARNFLITGYDFDSSWTKGFPYKSAATISAPAGDATLIAADINNFLYDAGGTANAIPVVSLFQDIDYEHKLFCKHAAQIINGSGVETYEPRVLEIVMYANVKSGADLTTCQTYFGVPVESTGNDVRWVMPTGDDASVNGYKAAPWLTQAKSMLAVNDGDLIYVKTFDPYLGRGGLGYLYADLYSSTKAVGRSVLRSTNAHYALRVLSNTAPLMERLYIIPDPALLDDAALYCSGGAAINFEKIYFLGSCYFILQGQWVSIKNSVLKATATAFGFYKTGGVAAYSIDTCLINSVLSVEVIYVFNGAGIATIKNNKFKGATTVGIWNADATDAVDIKGNVFDFTTILNTIYAEINNTQFNILNNVFYLKAAHTGDCIKLIGSYSKKTTIDGNIFIASGDSLYGAVYGISSYMKVSNNFFKLDSFVSNYGPIRLSGSANAIASLEVTNNRVICDNETGYHIAVGQENTTVADNTVAYPLITKNYIKGVNATRTPIPLFVHGSFIGFEANGEISYNYNWGSGYGFIFKGSIGTISTSRGGFYNVINNCYIGILLKGVSGVMICNNTVWFKDIANYGFYLAYNIGTGTDDASNCIVKNNIFIYLGAGNFQYAGMVEAGTGNVVDYNIYYCKNGNLIFQVSGVAKSWAQWRALGYDAHSIILTDAQYNALFTDPDNGDFTLKAGCVAIGTGDNIGAAYDDGLDASTNWGNDSTLPVVVTKQQGAAWDIGAYIH